MSGLIKRTAARTIVAPLRPAVAPIDHSAPAVDDPRIAPLEEEVARLRAALLAQQQANDAAVVAAREEGVKAAVSDDAARIAAVERGVADAVSAWRDRLADLDRLGVMLARAALAKMFGEADDLAAQVTRTIAHHVARIGDRSGITIRVSGADFAAPALADVAARADVAPDMVATDPALATGQCRIDLRLGSVDLDPGAQWKVLQQALDDLAVAG